MSVYESNLYPLFNVEYALELKSQINLHNQHIIHVLLKIES